MNNQIPKSWILLFLAVVGILVGLYLTSPDPVVTGESDALPETSRAITFEGMLLTGGNAIYLENQTAEQTQVLIGYVVLSAAGYVVVYDDNDGVPGEVVGVSDLLEDGGEHILMRVDEPLQDGEIYYAMLFHDDGDGLFRALSDTQAIDSTDSVILMTFEATIDAAPEVEAVMP